MLVIGNFKNNFARRKTMHETRVDSDAYGAADVKAPDGILALHRDPCYVFACDRTIAVRSAVNESRSETSGSGTWLKEALDQDEGG